MWNEIVQASTYDIKNVNQNSCLWHNRITKKWKYVWGELRAAAAISSSSSSFKSILNNVFDVDRARQNTTAMKTNSVYRLVVGRPTTKPFLTSIIICTEWNHHGFSEMYHGIIIVCLFYNCNLFKMERMRSLSAVVRYTILCTRHSSSSFHPCIILNRHIKCNYKMSISVSILVGRFLLSALLSLHRSLQFTFTKDKQFATWLFYLNAYVCIEYRISFVLNSSTRDAAWKWICHTFDAKSI